MKKSLKELRNSATRLLNKKELQTIKAGRMSPSCISLCTSDMDCGGVNRNCNEYYCKGSSGPTFKQCGP